jgi:phage repressor protein C with HTH and peptisase S24 domain
LHYAVLDLFGFKCFKRIAFTHITCQDKKSDFMGKTVFFNNLTKLQHELAYDLSDRQFCLRFNIAPDRYSEWKRGSMPSTLWLRRLAKNFNKSIDWFLTDHSEEETTKIADHVSQRVKHRARNVGTRPHSALTPPLTNHTRCLALDISDDEIKNIQEIGPYSLVARVEQRLSAGGGSFAIDETHVEEKLAFSTRYLCSKVEDRSRVLLVFISGDSMSPIIQDGDLVLLDRSQTDVVKYNRLALHRNDDHPPIYAVREDSRFWLKHVDVVEKGHTLILRLVSANPAYTPIETSVSDVEILGRVVWFCRDLK